MADLMSRGFGAGLIAVGAAFFHHHRKTQRELAASQLWHSVKGRVETSSVHQTPGSKPRYEARIRYRYQVDGRDHSGERITLGGEVRGARTRAEKWCEKYPEGREVDVFYDPASPDASCLERVHEGGALELAGGVLGIALGVALLAGLLPA